MFFLSISGNSYDLNLIGSVLFRVIHRKKPFGFKRPGRTPRAVPTPPQAPTAAPPQAPPSPAAAPPRDGSASVGPAAAAAPPKCASDGDEFRGVLKRSSSRYVSVSTRYLSFLDLMEYLGQGTSLRSFIQCFGDGKSEKLFYPFGLSSGPEGLDRRGMPPYHEFYDPLTDKNLLDEGKGRQHGLRNHAKMTEIFHQKGCETLRDWLMFYNIFDTRPFYQAVCRLIRMYSTFGVSMLDYSTLPGISNYVSLRAARGMFYNNTELHRPWHNILTSQIYGGYSSRLETPQAVVGETKILEEHFKENAVTVEAEYMYDFNALYSREVNMMKSHFRHYV